MKKPFVLFAAVLLCVISSKGSIVLSAAEEGSFSAQEIVENAIEAMYPVAKAEGIKGIRYQRYLYNEAGDLLMYLRGEAALPDTFEDTLYFSENKMKQQFIYKDGKALFLINEEEIDDELARHRIQEKAQRVAYRIFPLYRHRKFGNPYELIGRESVQGHECYTVQFTNNDSLKETFFIDKETYFVRKLEAEIYFDGEKKRVTHVFYDYKEIDGIWVPFSFQEEVEGSSFLNVETVSINFIY